MRISGSSPRLPLFPAGCFLGTVSGVPGLYLAQRIGSAARPLGVVVVKIEFERVQAQWAAQQGTTIVTDRHGVVIVTGRSDWRFRALAPLRLGQSRPDVRGVFCRAGRRPVART